MHKFDVPPLIATEYAHLDLSVKIDKISSFVVRAPIEVPVVNAFGVMRDRPALLLQVHSEIGEIGVGETWCNFPTCGAEHRARLIETAISPLLIGVTFSSPADCFHQLTNKLRLLAVQTGEYGPIAQCLAGIDIALWDLVARRHGLPLYRLFGGKGVEVNAYASGINPTDAAETAARARAQGYRAFKLKIGFGETIDMPNIEAMADDLGSNEWLMVDANQAWSAAEALRMIDLIQDFPIKWLEEPIVATASTADWLQLAAASSIDLAGGENLFETTAFEGAAAGTWLNVIQPDMCKWGGFSGTVPIARLIRRSGKLYCPHFLGGGVGLSASAHLLAAIGGDGLLEVDCNVNPLRSQVFEPVLLEGKTSLPTGPGLGIDPALLIQLHQEFKSSQAGFP